MTIRKATENDVHEIRKVHRRSVTELATPYYPSEVISEWAANQEPEAIERHKEKIRTGVELTWVAEVDGKIEGFAVLVPSESELRAVYVTGDMARRRIGSELLQVIEKNARDLGLKKLGLHSSIPAYTFYEKNGYRNLGEGSHTMRSGRKMDCFIMEKDL